MNTTFSRRKFLATSEATIATAGSVERIAAQSTATHEIPHGGIGWPREVFDHEYGQGVESGALMIYTNPYLEGSELAVLFENEIATFIDVSIPANGPGDMAPEALLQNLSPLDATSVGSRNIPSVDGTPDWGFHEYHADSMNMASSGATLMQTTTAHKDNLLVRATVSLAISDGASEFAPAEGSVGAAANIAEWKSEYGDGTDGHAATGHYDATWFINPWDKVVVYSRRRTEVGETLTSISAISAPGVDPDSAFVFTESILPQGAELRAGYVAPPVEGKPQGWGVSTWDISETQRVMLFMLGAGDGSGNVLQVASSLYTAE